MDLRDGGPTLIVASCLTMDAMRSDDAMRLFCGSSAESWSQPISSVFGPADAMTPDMLDASLRLLRDDGYVMFERIRHGGLARLNDECTAIPEDRATRIGRAVVDVARRIPTLAARLPRRTEGPLSPRHAEAFMWDTMKPSDVESSLATRTAMRRVAAGTLADGPCATRLVQAMRAIGAACARDGETVTCALASPWSGATIRRDRGRGSPSRDRLAFTYGRGDPSEEEPMPDEFASLLPTTVVIDALRGRARNRKDTRFVVKRARVVVWNDEAPDPMTIVRTLSHLKAEPLRPDGSGIRA